MANQWVARMHSISFPGGYMGNGELRLHGRMHDAGNQTGRHVEIAFDPSQLDTVARLVASAIAQRESWKAAMSPSVGDLMTSIHQSSEGEYRKANGIS